VNRDGRFDLDLLNVDNGRITTVASAAEVGGGHFHEVGWGPDGEIVYVWENAWSPPDLYIRRIESPHEEARQLTFSSHAAFRPEHFARVERVSFPSYDGLVLGGFLLTPRGLRSGDRLPAIVSIHGGTYGQHYDHWNPFLHYLTESGFVLLMVDQRGSGGYGRQFRASIKGSYEIGVLEDIRAMVGFLKSRPFVDPTRLVSMGKSHGGYRTLYALVRAPELFIAGIDLFGPTDRRTPYLNQIGGYHIDATEAEDSDLYERLSPITMVEKLRAPILIIHSNQDRNVPGAMSYNFVDELERHHKEYEVIYYPGEAHGLADPAHLLDAYRRIEAFLQKHVPR
jgi:dipeptidyl aminopeptidase/acylaminoacyl peptidase